MNLREKVKYSLYKKIKSLFKPDNHNQLNNQGNKNVTDESTTCRFCGFFNPDFDEDALFMHFYKECPMVIFFEL